MQGIVKVDALISLEAAADHRGKEGYFVEFASGKAAISNAATDEVVGAIVDGADEGGRDGIALPNFAGIVKVKLGAAATQGAYGVLSTDGTVIPDAGSGARRRVCRFLEAGAAGDLVDAYLINPLALS